MGVVLLIRHGQAAFGAEYGGLTDLGVEQATKVGAALRTRGVVPSLVVTGSLGRQTRTAAVCLERIARAAAPPVGGRWNEYDPIAVLAAHGDPATPPPTKDARAFQAALDAAILGWMDAPARKGDVPTWAEFSDGAVAALGAVVGQVGRGQTCIVVTSG